MKGSTHEGVRYPCSQCAYKVTTKPHLMERKQSIHERVRYPLQTCSYWYSYNDTMELIAGASEQIYHFEELINAGVV